MTRDWFVTMGKSGVQIMEHTSMMEPEDWRTVAVVATREEAEYIVKAKKFYEENGKTS